MKALLILFMAFSGQAWAWRCNVPTGASQDASRDENCYSGLLQRLEANIKYDIARLYTRFLTEDPAQGTTGFWTLKLAKNRGKVETLLNELKAIQELKKLNTDARPLVQCVAPESD